MNVSFSCMYVGMRVNRLMSHPVESSWVIGSMLGNNEVSMWNLETKQRQSTLWASPTPLLSTKEVIQQLK